MEVGPSTSQEAAAKASTSEENPADDGSDTSIRKHLLDDFEGVTAYGSTDIDILSRKKKRKRDEGYEDSSVPNPRNGDNGHHPNLPDDEDIFGDAFQPTPFALPSDYHNKKNAGTALMDFALFVNNFKQLREIFKKEVPLSDFYINLTLIAASITLQIGLGVFLAMHFRYDLRKRKHLRQAEIINNWATFFIFLITAINVAIPNLDDGN